MAIRLPQPGQDEGIWGGLLNDYLSVEHDSQGVLKIRTDGTLSPVPLVTIKKAGTAIGTRAAVNLIEGANTTLTVVDNPGANRVDVTVTASGGGAPSFSSLSPYFATGVRDYSVVFPGGGFDTPAYALVNGIVYFRGVIETTNQASGTTFTNLPNAIRPAAVRSILISTGNGTKRLDINPNGTVTYPGGGIITDFATLDTCYTI